tara:strand:- start:185669 stop:186448 length:780 start_codon:yes stop_codon:yes gene_type:complete
MIVKARDGTSLNVDIRGKAGAPLVVFVNPLGSDLGFWDKVVQDFEDFQTVRFDFRGTGRSGTSQSAASIEVFANDVLDILDALDCRKAHFVGLSLGGMIGMWLGAAAPQHFGRMVLANTTPHIPLRDMWNSRIQQARNGELEKIAAETGARWTSEAFRQNHPDEYAKFVKTFASTPIEGYVGCCEVLRDTDLRDTLPRIKLPVRIIGGQMDLASSREIAAQMAQSIPGADCQIIPGAGHLTNIESTSTFNALVREWVAG